MTKAREEAVQAFNEELHKWKTHVYKFPNFTVIQVEPKMELTAFTKEYPAEETVTYYRFDSEDKALAWVVERSVNAAIDAYEIVVHN